MLLIEYVGHRGLGSLTDGHLGRHLEYFKTDNDARVASVGFINNNASTTRINKEKNFIIKFQVILVFYRTVAKGLGISAWSENVLYHCPNSIEDTINIALGREIFSGCYTCSQNHKYNVLDQPLFLQTNKTSCYKPNTHNTKIHRFKPYKKNHGTNYKCKAYSTQVMLVFSMS